MINNKETFKAILQKHIDIIVDTLISNIYGINTIILYGGYGRDEGAWVKINNSYEPYNDFDILIVLNEINEKPALNQIELIKKNLLEKINIQWIDLTFIELKDFSKSNKKSIFQFDLKNGSKVIYGNKGLLTKVNSIDSSQIRLVEGKLLFFTRLWPFAGGAESIIDLNQSQSLFFRYQMSKAILAAIDMKLLMQGMYVSSYVDRCQLAIDIGNKNDILDKDIINWAITQKLTPCNKMMKAKEVFDLQKKVAHIFSFYSLQILSCYYNKKFPSLMSFYKFYSKSFKENIKIIGAKILQKKIDYKKIHYFNNIQILILCVILDEVTEDYIIKESNNYLVKMGTPRIFNLNDLRKFISNERLS